jgi:hypothetical protein
MFENYLVAMPVFVSRLRLREQFQKILCSQTLRISKLRRYLLVVFPQHSLKVLHVCEILLSASVIKAASLHIDFDMMAPSVLLLR